MTMMMMLMEVMGMMMRLICAKVVSLPVGGTDADDDKNDAKDDDSEDEKNPDGTILTFTIFQVLLLQCYKSEDCLASTPR